MKKNARTVVTAAPSSYSHGHRAVDACFHTASACSPCRRQVATKKEDTPLLKSTNGRNAAVVFHDAQHQQTTPTHHTTCRCVTMTWCMHHQRVSQCIHTHRLGNPDREQEPVLVTSGRMIDCYCLLSHTRYRTPTHRACLHVPPRPV